MKVFISHSSKDKWAAKRISEEIESLEIETFLDEKDISTGQSIDQSIKSNINDCDDFLILLTPASIKSEWVLIELGGALALGKNIVPVLLYVGANEIPKIISLRLARDINDIRKYYGELQDRLKGKIIEHGQVNKTKAQDTDMLKIGDRVKIISKAPPDHYRDEGLDIYWESDQEQYLGMHTKVALVFEELESYALEIDNKEFFWHKDWLIY